MSKVYKCPGCGSIKFFKYSTVKDVKVKCTALVPHSQDWDAACNGEMILMEDDDDAQTKAPVKENTEGD